MDRGQLCCFLTFRQALLTPDILCTLHVPEIENSMEMEGGGKQRQTEAEVALKAGNKEVHDLQRIKGQ